MDPRNKWDDDDEWNAPRRKLPPAVVERANRSGRRGWRLVIACMYVLAALLILIQILRFYLGPA